MRGTDLKCGTAMPQLCAVTALVALLAASVLVERGCLAQGALKASAASAGAPAPAANAQKLPAITLRNFAAP